MRRIDELSEHLTKRQETYKTQSGVRNTITKIDYWGLATENIRINQKWRIQVLKCKIDYWGLAAN